jgi:hypothetical protein
MTTSAWVLAIPVLLAHEGGWDEMLMVLVPILLIVLLLWVARRRALRAVPSEDGTEETQPSP